MRQPRIVSFLPGATEWVCELGLGECLVGVSHECDYPAALAGLPKVTRSRIDVNAPSEQIDATVREHSESRTPLFELDAAMIASLQPNLILTQTLCNVCAVSESDIQRSLQTIGDCVLVDLRAMTFDTVFSDAETIVHATNRMPKSRTAIESLRCRIQTVRKSSERETVRPRVVLLEWVSPLFCAGHWTPQLIQWAGGHDPIGESGTPSRQIDEAELARANPDILLVACCGLDRQRGIGELEQLKDLAVWQNLNCVLNEQVHVFDGSAWFNRPGPRLVDALESVASLIGDWKKSHPLAD